MYRKLWTFSGHGVYILFLNFSNRSFLSLFDSLVCQFKAECFRHVVLSFYNPHFS